MNLPRTSWETPKGTSLPLLNLKGKEYLTVAQRIRWFREENPLGRIDTDCITFTNSEAHFRAIISIKAADGTYIKLADANKYETKQGFPDYLEKAQTGAVGRALALCGYGTQFCADELEEGERLADSPVDPVALLASYASQPAQPFIPDAAPIITPQFLTGYVVGFGKYKGKRLQAENLADLNNYASYLKKTALSSGKPLSDAANTFCAAVDFLTHELPSALKPAPTYETNFIPDMGGSRMQEPPSYVTEDVPF